MSIGEHLPTFCKFTCLFPNKALCIVLMNNKKLITLSTYCRCESGCILAVVPCQVFILLEMFHISSLITNFTVLVLGFPQKIMHNCDKRIHSFQCFYKYKCEDYDLGQNCDWAILTQICFDLSHPIVCLATRWRLLFYWKVNVKSLTVFYFSKLTCI